MPTEAKSKRDRLKNFIVFNVIEECILAVLAFVLLVSLAPTFLIPGMVIVIIGLIGFTLVKIYTYQSSATIPVYDPLIGQVGFSITEFLEDAKGVWQGKVKVRGEIWKAQALELISNDMTIRVLGIEGLTLLVTTTEKNELCDS